MPVRVRLKPSALGRTLPQGTLVVGIGLIVSGATAYAFLVVTARVLGPERYVGLSVLWALTFLGALTFFVPLEQELARALAERRVHGHGSAPVVRRAAVAGMVTVAVLLVAIGAAWRSLYDHFFDGEALLIVGFAIALFAYSGVYLLRGALEGNGRFVPVGVLLGVEGVVRLLGCVVLALAGVRTSGPYGIILGVAPVVAAITVLWGTRLQLAQGPPASWRELSGSLGNLLLGALCAQVLINGPPLAVKALSSASAQMVTGSFLACIIAARIPLFVFASVLAALMPTLSALAARGRIAEFEATIRRLLVMVLGMGAMVTATAAVAGQAIVKLLFGSEFILGRGDITALTAASGVYMVALLLAQALIALNRHSRATLGWLVGVGGFMIGMLPPFDVIQRVEFAFLIGSLAAAVAMLPLLLSQLRRTSVVAIRTP